MGNGINASLPDLYWNAAGAMYAYLYGKLVLDGVEVLGHSQLAGSPEIPEWGIPAPQYPSVSLLSWQTGYGNARYWALKLLLEHFQPGDLLFNTTFNTSQPAPPANGTNPFCGEVRDVSSYPPVQLECLNGGRITAINYADWGNPNGTCPNYIPGKCSDVPNAMIYSLAQCFNQTRCLLDPAQILDDDCFLHVKTFVVVATCDNDAGGWSHIPFEQAYALGIIGSKDGRKRILLINKSDENHQYTFSNEVLGGVLYLVDPLSAQASAKQGIRAQAVKATTVTLLPFAVGVLVLP